MEQPRGTPGPAWLASSGANYERIRRLRLDRVDHPSRQWEQDVLDVGEDRLKKEFFDKVWKLPDVERAAAQ
ncbi:hypothetical protein DXU07_28225 [Bradyrhizobium elkanii]|uniref:hypothetical protein n=1 Tax=Bradyrhizobium elkanii TaxID=29448 RepID=UPI0005727683|nr:hypothetical protein [Bradyrhizobium elkanii]MCW2191981.1 hypothetical protein [Bradyrhizobium elkanii]OIM93206.1 hypothetical protein BLN97_17825 [Bradyrhizobium elkanii]